MAEYSVAQAKDNLSSLIAKAEAGEAVIITKRGKPVVELRVAQAQALDPDRVRAAHERLRQQREKMPQVSITSAELLRLENEDLRY